MITTNVIGELFVIHDPNGELQTVVGGQTTLDFQQIYTLLRGTFGDHYDFLSCYLDTGSGVINIGTASSAIFQDATGIGRWTFNFRSGWGTSKLQQYQHYSQFNLSSFLHEVGHRWLANVNYALAPGGPAQHLLHQDWIWTPGGEGVHWGRWIDNQNSCMDYDQAEWIDNMNGTFNRIDRDPTIAVQDDWFGYSPLDQYLMGLVPASAVPPFRVIQNPTPALSELGPYGVPTGPYTPSPGAVTVTIAQVQNTRSDEPAPFSGPRTPDHLSSQRVFHEATVIVTNNTALSTTFITNTEAWRRKHSANFRKVTSGRAMIDTSLLRANYADLYMKDNSGDSGAVPTAAPFWFSPDLWVRNAQDGGLTDQPTKRNQSNWIYARVHNKSTQAYQNVTINFYLGNSLSLLPGTQFLYPVDWNPSGLLGSATIANVPAATGGVAGEAITNIEWTANLIPPASGWHPCLLAEVLPMEVEPSGLHRVQENRKLAQRNITIIDPLLLLATGSFLFAYEFLVGHELSGERRSRLHLRAERHSERVRLFLDPDGLVDDLGEHAAQFDLPIPFSPTQIPSGADGVQPIKPLPPGEYGRQEDSARATADRYGLRGMRPVSLNKLPLLEITNPRDAALDLPLRAGERRRLRVFGVVSESDEDAVYHLTEELGGELLGGVTVMLKLSNQRRQKGAAS
jgi:hypothetical protein